VSGGLEWGHRRSRPDDESVTILDPPLGSGGALNGSLRSSSVLVARSSWCEVQCKGQVARAKWSTRSRSEDPCTTISAQPGRMRDSGVANRGAGSTTARGPAELLRGTWAFQLWHFTERRRWWVVDTCLEGSNGATDSPDRTTSRLQSSTRLRGSSGSSRFQPTQSPVWIIACTIQSLLSRVDGRTNIGAQLNATIGKPRFRGATQPARARWSTPRLSSQHADQYPFPRPATQTGMDFRLAVLGEEMPQLESPGSAEQLSRPARVGRPRASHRNTRFRSSTW